MRYFKYFPSNLYKKHRLVNSLSLLAVGSYFYKNLYENHISKDIEFCGIIGYIKQNKSGKKSPTASKYSTCHILSQALLLLQNRGYDSAGIATMDSDKETFFEKDSVFITIFKLLGNIKPDTYL